MTQRAKRTLCHTVAACLTCGLFWLGVSDLDRENSSEVTSAWSAARSRTATPPAADLRPDYGLLLRQVEQNAALWASTKITSYEVTFTISAFAVLSPYPARVAVRNGKVVRSEYKTSTGLWSRLRPGYDRMTVEDLFAEIRGLIASHPDELSVTYDERLGYPRHIDVNGRRMTSDDEMTLDIHALRPFGH